MSRLEKMADSIGRLSNWKVLPVLVLAVILSISMVAAGCGTEGRADTTEDATAEKSQEQKAENEEQDGESETEGEEEKVAVPVSVAAVQQGSVSAYLSATANLVAENQVKVLADSVGRVDRLLVDEGQFVRKGQLLAALEADDERIALAKAEVKQTNASMAFQRGEDLSNKELISREEMDKLRMDFEIAKQEFAEAQWKIRRTEIHAPFSGQISERMIQLGQHVQNGDELFQITDFEPLIARIYFPENDVIGLEDGREVRVSLNADPSVKFPGRIRHVSDVVDTSTGTVKITIEAPGAPKGVRPGSFVTVDIVRETRADALKLPKEAVIRELRSAHVFVAKDNIAEKREVQLGLEEGAWIEALAGVESGEEVIVLGQGGLKDGSDIKILGADGTEIRES